MAPKKKSAPRNAFYFFMQDFKAREEAKGQTFPNGLRDVAVAADPEWKELQPNEKRTYENMAKEWKLENRQSADKYTTCGKSFKMLEENIRREEEERRFMNESVEKEIMRLTSKTALKEKFFYLMHVNYYCEVDGNIFIPAEIAIVEFTLNDGITREYHTFVNQAQIPIGYTHTAQSHSRMTHEIPVGFDKGEKNFFSILQNIKTFLMKNQASNELPPIYTMPDNKNLNNSFQAVKSTLRGLCEASVNYEDPDIFRVFMVGKLFFELQSVCRRQGSGATETQMPLFSLAEVELERDVFNYCSGIACDFHENIDRRAFCSLSTVKRWVFIICDDCCQDLNIALIPGKHCPIHAVLPKRTTASSDVNSAIADPEPEEETSDDENKIVAQEKYFSYADTMQRKEEPLRRPHSSVGRSVSAGSFQPPPPMFSDKHFPAIGSLSLSDTREAPPFYSNDNFPALGRGRGRPRGGKGKGNTQSPGK